MAWQLGNARIGLRGGAGNTAAMKPLQSFTVLTCDHRFQVLIYGSNGVRAPFAEFCGSSEGCERMTRVGVPQNLVFAGDESAAEWLLRACLADIAAVAGIVRSVRADKEGNAPLAPQPVV